MTHSKASFSSAQIKRLIKLRAVVKVSPSRIRYAEWFKRECVMRADAGESPTYLFREAGLGPELIGEKRIERCMDRWRKKMQLEDLEVASSPERLFSVDMDTEQDREVCSGRSMSCVCSLHSKPSPTICNERHGAS